MAHSQAVTSGEGSTGFIEASRVITWTTPGHMDHCSQSLLTLQKGGWRLLHRLDVARCHTVSCLYWAQFSQLNIPAPRLCPPTPQPLAVTHFPIEILFQAPNCSPVSSWVTSSSHFPWWHMSYAMDEEGHGSPKAMVKRLW